MFLWFGLVMFAVGVLATWAVLDALYIAPLQAQVDEMTKQRDRMWVRRMADELGYAHYRNMQHLGTPYIQRDNRDHSKSAELRSV